MITFKKQKKPMKTYQDEIIANILKIMKDKDITQADIVRKTGMDKSTVSKLISGETLLKVNTLSEISTALGVSVADIVTYPGGNDTEPVEAILQIRLKKDKKDQVLRLVFGDNNIEILNR